MEKTFNLCDCCQFNEAKRVLESGIKLCEQCSERINYDEQRIYVIYWDGGVDDASHIFGYINGTEVEALQCCKALSERRGYTFDEIVYEALDNLNELIGQKEKLTI